MRSIMFYPRSRNMKPHIDEEGTVHVPISEWDKVLAASEKTGGWVPRKKFPNYPTNGTTQRHGSDA